MLSDRTRGFLFVLLVHLLVCVNGNIITIAVNNNGNDTANCITAPDDKSSCKTLHYVLNELSLAQLETKDVTIIIENSQTIQSIDISYDFELNITVFGVGQPSLSCVDNGYLHFSSEDNINVEITFDGITFQNCNGYWSDVFEDWITGYTFLNFGRIVLLNLVITNSSDILLAGNEFVSIENCLFEDNLFHYGLVYIPTTDINTIADNSTLLSISIDGCLFRGNTGLTKSLILNHIATIYVIVTITNEQKVVYVYISDCEFHDNLIIGDHDRLIGVNSTKVTDIGINVTDANLGLLNITIERSKFYNNSASAFSKIIDISCKESKLGSIYSHIQAVSFVNNSFMNTGEMVSIYLKNVVSRVPSMLEYIFNDISSNIGDGLMIRYSNMSNVKFTFIQHSRFEKNFGKSVYIYCDICLQSENIVNISNIEVIGNTIPFIKIGAFETYQSTTFISNSSFINNTGTALQITDTQFYPLGILYFVRNAATYGGGISMYGKSNFFANDAIAIFTNNLALYGGAIYIGIESIEVHACSSFVADNCDFIFHFTNNKASSSGDNVFFVENELAECVIQYISLCFNATDHAHLGFGSSVTTIQHIYGNNNSTNILTIFPGQNIPINSSVMDAFGSPSSCVAAVYLQCGNQVIGCESDDGRLLQLEGPTRITIGLLAYKSNIKLLAPKNFTTFNNPLLQFRCPSTPTYTLHLDIIDCPVGFLYNETVSGCQCALEGHSGFLCSISHGIACVAKGYWIGGVEGKGEENITIIAQCRYLYCNGQTNPCPNSIGYDASSYVLVGLTEDEQCERNHGGVLCSNCKNGSTFSFEGLLCIENEECEQWHPYTILVLVTLFQFVLAYVIQLFLSIQIFCGIGFLLGPLFYLAVVNTLPLAYFEEYYELKKLVSCFTSIFLLNMEIFGQIEWCFFQLKSLENYAFHYLGPLIVTIVVVVTILIARKCPKLQKYLKISPIQTICLLFLLSFWSLSDTNVHILQVVRFPGAKHTRVAIQPDLPYFTGTHIPLAILAILINLVIVLPFILLMLLAPFISKKISLYRIQPLLDQFQSSYKDNFRWYPSVYMIGWVIILFAYDQSNTLILQAVLIVMLTMFYIMQPYSTKWMNVTNSLFVLDLIIVTSLISQQGNSSYDYTEQSWIKAVIIVLVHILIVLPLLYIIIGMIWIIMIRFNIHIYLKNKFWPSKLLRKLMKHKNGYSVSFNTDQLSSKKRVSSQFLQIAEDKDDEYRESLMVLVEEDAIAYGTK